VCPDWLGSWGEDPPDDEAPAPQSPYGPRPAGMRPAGMRQAGMRPAGMRPAGMRPAGMRPAGMRPAGMRPAGMRPAGMRPAGMRPAGMRDDDPQGFLDPEEWSADIAELFCAESAVVRLGARLVHIDHALPLPAVEPREGKAGYLASPGSTDLSAAAPPRLAPSRVPPAGLTERRLNPNDHQLAVRVGLPNYLARAVAEQPDGAWALKQDIANALALGADRAFLHGHHAADAPVGIGNTFGVDRISDGPDLLATMRNVLTEIRDNAREARFGCAGWILDPKTLEDLTRLLTADGVEETDNDPQRRSLDSTPLLVLDGQDGGVLLGYPFIVSRAAVDAAGETHTYFSSDWSEAWIGAAHALVSIDVSVGAEFESDETAVRAVMHHDFLVRRPSFFLYTGPEITAPPVAR
jgi:hypothetical protein